MPEPILPSPDLLLARRAAAGQAAAWDEIVELYGGRLFNLALQFAASREEAEDLTQEIFLRLYQGLRRYRGEAPLAAWALRLSRNLCVDHYRRTRRERQATVVVDAASDQALLDRPAADDPWADCERRRELAAVEAALARMPEELAEVIVLRDLQGFSLEETAVALDLPLGTVKSRLHRARIELAGRVVGDLRPPAAAQAGVAP